MCKKINQYNSELIVRFVDALDIEPLYEKNEDHETMRFSVGNFDMEILISYFFIYQTEFAATRLDPEEGIWTKEFVKLEDVSIYQGEDCVDLYNGKMQEIINLINSKL